MNGQLKELDATFWEVWIEYDPLDPNYFGMLYIHGELFVNRKLNFTLIRNQNESSSNLSLKIPETISEGNHFKEVIYSEPIRNLNQYTSVSIYAGSEFIAKFNIDVFI